MTETDSFALAQVWDASTQAYVTTAKPFGKSLAVEELALGIARFFYPPLSPPSRAEQATSFSSSPAPVPRALPLDLLLPVLRTLTRRLDSLIALWSTLPLRMRGGSLLIVVEGDPATLEAALLRAAAPGSEAEDDGESVSTTDEEGNAKDHTLLPFEMRLIDFAHTRGLLPGEEGPDEGVLLGLRTTKKLIDELVTQLEEKQRKGDE